MEYVANILILLATISSVVLVPNKTFNQRSKTEEDRIMLIDTMDNLNGRVCPPFGKKAKFEVETIQTKSPMYGCAYLGNKTQLSTASLFHLWVERPVETKVHGHCNNMQNMDHFMFECLSKNIHINEYESQLGWQYISLLEHKTDENSQSETSKRYHRCALYDVKDVDDKMMRIIRLAISKPIVGDQFNISQCFRLSELFDRKELPLLPQGSRYWPDGSMYLYLVGRKAKSFMTTRKNPVTSPTTTTTTTTTSRPSSTTTTSRPSSTTTTSRPSITTTTRRATTTSTTTAHYSIDDFFKEFIINNNS